MIEAKQGTKWEILRWLREVDEATRQDFQDKLEVSPSTLNEHLSDLQAKGFVDNRSERDGPGRPHYVYFLTEEAEHLFPHGYSELAKMLLDVIRSMASEPEAEEKINTVMKEHFSKYDDTETALSRLGFYPDVKEENGTKSFVYHQCPFYDVAKEEPALCSIDRSVLDDLMDGSVSMESSIAKGDNACRFVVSEN